MGEFILKERETSEDIKMERDLKDAAEKYVKERLEERMKQGQSQVEAIDQLNWEFCELVTEREK